MAPDPDERSRPGGARRAPSFRQLLRHQAGAGVATAVDFAAMIACVEAGLLAPVAATAVGAAAGAMTNFSLGRRWIFAARGGGVAPQAVRYALVSAASLGWNALGVHALHGLLGAPYVAARAIVALAVSVLWNYPLHAKFVFRPPGPAPDLPAAPPA